MELDDALLLYKINVNNGIGQIDIDGSLSVGDQTVGDKTTINSSGQLTLSGEGTIFNDVQFSIATAKQPPVNAPTWAAFIGNLGKYTFAVNDYVDLEAQEIPHGTLPGSDKEWHIHIFTNGLEAVDKVVNFQIEFAITAEDEAPTVLTVSGDFTIPANTPDQTKLYIHVGIVNGTGQDFENDISAQVKRIAAVSGTAPAADPFVSMVGLHVEQYKLGSENRTS